jgi:hypothetical protein
MRRNSQKTKRCMAQNPLQWPLIQAHLFPPLSFASTFVSTLASMNCRYLPDFSLRYQVCTPSAVGAALFLASTFSFLLLKLRRWRHFATRCLIPDGSVCAGPLAFCAAGWLPTTMTAGGSAAVICLFFILHSLLSWILHTSLHICFQVHDSAVPAAQKTCALFLKIARVVAVSSRIARSPKLRTAALPFRPSGVADANSLLGSGNVPEWPFVSLPPKLHLSTSGSQRQGPST